MTSLRLIELYLFIDRFDAQVPDDQAGQVLEQERQRNMVIEQVINDMRAQNPDMDEILGKLVEWQ